MDKLGYLNKSCMVSLDNKREPLVSVVVITYNSSKTVIETLESIKAQTYTNIELVVSDDCSKDNTFEKCKQWITANSSRFVRSLVVSTEKNSGVAPNLNNGIKNCSGEWFKLIAGDDLFVDNAIEVFISFVVEHSGCRICLSQLDLFGGDPKIMAKMEIFLENKFAAIRNKNQKQQYMTSLRRQLLPGPGLFMQKSLWEEVGGYNERYPMAEEYPFEIRMLSVTRGFMLDKKLVKWRQRMDSLSHISNSPSNAQLFDFYRDVQRKLLLDNHLYLWVLDKDLITKQLETNKWYFKVLRCLSPLSLVRLLNKFSGCQL